MKEIREYHYEALKGTPGYLDLRVNQECEIAEGQTCVICGQPLKLGWTIQHGVADCVYCGVPYLVYHRDKDGKLTSRKPECIVKPDVIPECAEAWKKAENYVDFRMLCVDIVGKHKKKGS